MLDAPNAEGQPFAEVAENHFELGIFIEQAAAHQTQRMNRSLNREPPSRPGNPSVSFISLLPRGQGEARMKIEGHIKLLHCCPERPIWWQVIEDCRIRFVELRESIDQRA